MSKRGFLKEFWDPFEFFCMDGHRGFLRHFDEIYELYSDNLSTITVTVHIYQYMIGSHFELLVFDE
jgi:hypothetical protein